MPTDRQAELLLEAMKLSHWSARPRVHERLNDVQDVVVFGKQSSFKWKHGGDKGKEKVSCSVDGVILKLYPRGAGPNARHFHRLYVHCPMCGKEIPLGRIAQHAAIHFPYVDGYRGEWYTAEDGFRRYRRVPTGKKVPRVAVYADSWRWNCGTRQFEIIR